MKTSGLLPILTRGVLAAAMLALSAAAPILVVPDTDPVDAQICESPALAADVVGPDQADIVLEPDFLTVLTTRDLSRVPSSQIFAWRRSASASAQDYTPLSLLLVATQASTTDL